MSVEWKIDQGDVITTVTTDHLPERSCMRCFGRGYRGRHTDSNLKRQLYPCGCIGRVWASKTEPKVSP